jgi:hypothetical protein
MTSAAVQSKEGKGKSSKALLNAYFNESAFPSKLYHLLERTAYEPGLNSIISWLPGGSAFKIHKPDEFIKNILSNYFRKQTRFKSFTRQVSSIDRTIVLLFNGATDIFLTNICWVFLNCSIALSIRFL